MSGDDAFAALEAQLGPEIRDIRVANQRGDDGTLGILLILRFDSGINLNIPLQAGAADDLADGLRRAVRAVRTDAAEGGAA